MHIVNQKPLEQGDGPIALVMAPTRELAQQIQQVATQFGAPSKVRNTCLYGGSAKSFQLADIRRGCELIVATPGRLIDLLETGALNLHRVSYLVLDEGKNVESWHRASTNQILYFQLIACWTWDSNHKCVKLYHKFALIDKH